MALEKCLQLWKPYNCDNGTTYVTIDHAIDSCRLSVFLGTFFSAHYDAHYHQGTPVCVEELNDKIIKGDKEFWSCSYSNIFIYPSIS